MLIVGRLIATLWTTEKVFAIKLVQQFSVTITFSETELKSLMEESNPQ